MPSSVQNWLKSLGCIQALYPSSLGQIRSTATWNPAADWNGSDSKDTFFLRYGFYNSAIPGDGSNIPSAELHLYSAGNYVGESLPSPFPGQSPFLDVMRKLTADSSLILTFQDLEDLRTVKDPNVDDLVYNTKIKPLIVAATIPTTPAPPMPAPIPLPPVPLPSPVPVSVPVPNPAPVPTPQATPSDLSQFGTTLAQSIVAALSTSFAALLQAELARLLPKQSSTPAPSSQSTPIKPNKPGRKPRK